MQIFNSIFKALSAGEGKQRNVDNKYFINGIDVVKSGELFLNYFDYILRVKERSCRESVREKEIERG